jgi:hypothetical protein
LRSVFFILVFPTRENVILLPCRDSRPCVWQRLAKPAADRLSDRFDFFPVGISPHPSIHPSSVGSCGCIEESNKSRSPASSCLCWIRLRLAMWWVGGKRKRIISNYIIIPFEPDCWLCASIDRMARVCVCVFHQRPHNIFFKNEESRFRSNLLIAIELPSSSLMERAAVREPLLILNLGWGRLKDNFQQVF